MEPLYVAVCEDQLEEREELLSLLADGPISCRATAFPSGEDLLTAWRSHTFDLLLMDIYMDGMTGVETVRQLRDRGEELPVAFITSSVDHALDSYRLSALKYIEKPVRPKDVAEILELARLKKIGAPALTVQRNGQEERIALSDILYLEQQGHVANLHLKDGTVKPVYEKLSSIAARLENQPFFQTHKSFLVHLAFISRVDPDLRCFVMADGRNVPIRRELLGKAKRAWEDFLFARTRSAL